MFFRISDKEMSIIIDLLKKAFEHAKLSDSLNGMKKNFKEVRFNLHVRPCVLIISCCIGGRGGDLARGHVKFIKFHERRHTE